MNGSGLGYHIWCEQCACDNAEDIASWEFYGTAIVRSGRLKTAVECDACEVQILVGERVDAITFLRGLPELYSPWEENYLELDPQGTKCAD